MTRKFKPFSPQRLLEQLERFPSCPALWVGFSGGADSTALLVAIHDIQSSLGSQLKVLHVNHGLQESSEAWESHCRAFCEDRGIDLVVRQVRVDLNGGSGREAAARKARYGIVEELIGDGDIFLTAHHMDDQAETLILNLVRGSGVDGLAGMPEIRQLGRGLLARPLLGFSMQSLRKFLLDQDVSWLEDPSNQDQSYDRNFVRNNIIPALSRRWPGVEQRIARSACLSRQASQSLSNWTAAQLPQHLLHPQVLSLNKLPTSDASFAFLLRSWLEMNQAPSLPSRQLEELLLQCLNARPDHQVNVVWQGWTIHLYKHCLWIQAENTIRSCPDLNWSVPGPLQLGSGLGILEIQPAPSVWPENWKVFARHGGESMVLHSGGHHQALKDIYREKGIPPWLRASIPLLAGPGGLLAIGDFVLSEELSNWLGENQSELVWQPTDSLLRFIQLDCTN